MKENRISSLILFCLFWTSASYAQNSELAPVPSPTPVAVTTPETVSDWKPKMEWGGDLRYRFAKKKESVDDARTLQQLRARLGIKADVNEEVQAILRLATASSAVSTNQTLGDSKEPGMPRRSFGLDLAYMDWKFAPASGGHAWLGRTANPFWSPGKSQIVFDSDLAFEGLSFKFEPKWSSSGLFFNAGAYIISENYSAASRSDVVDTGLASAQLGYTFQSSAGSWTVHAATHHYLNVQDKPIATLDKGAAIDPYSSPYDRYMGNTLYADPPGTYFFADPYSITEYGLEWKNKWGDFEATVFADFVKNEEIGEGNLGHEYGISFKWGRAQLGYAHIEKESDSVVGAFTDSDANGGGTDNRGQRASFVYQLGKNSQFALTDFRAKRGVSTVERDYSSTMADFIVSF